MTAKDAAADDVAATAAVAAAVAVADAAESSSVSSKYGPCAAGCGEPAIVTCRCLGAFYCSQECLVHAWPAHRGPCEEAVATRASIGVDTIKDAINKMIIEYKRLANAGDATAQLNLGICYANGTGVTVDMLESFKWNLSAATLGNVTAQLHIAACYAYGCGGFAVDKREAVKWFKRAAEARRSTVT